MTKQQVEGLTNEDLQSQWVQIVQAFRLRMQLNLSHEQFNILFADFVNVGTEMDKRGINTDVKQ